MSSTDTPSSFICCITSEVMSDPVSDRDGNSYERAAITEWLKRQQVSPITRNPLQLADLVPNRALRDAIEAWKTGRLQSASPHRKHAAAAAASSSSSSAKPLPRLNSAELIDVLKQRNVSDRCLAVFAADSYCGSDLVHPEFVDEAFDAKTCEAHAVKPIHLRSLKKILGELLAEHGGVQSDDTVVEAPEKPTTTNTTLRRPMSQLAPPPPRSGGGAAAPAASSAAAAAVLDIDLDAEMRHQKLFPCIDRERKDRATIRETEQSDFDMMRQWRQQRERPILERQRKAAVERAARQAEVRFALESFHQVGRNDVVGAEAAAWTVLLASPEKKQLDVDRKILEQFNAAKEAARRELLKEAGVAVRRDVLNDEAAQRQQLEGAAAESLARIDEAMEKRREFTRKVIDHRRRVTDAEADARKQAITDFHEQLPLTSIRVPARVSLPLREAEINERAVLQRSEKRDFAQLQTEQLREQQGVRAAGEKRAAELRAKQRADALREFVNAGNYSIRDVLLSEDTAWKELQAMIGASFPIVEQRRRAAATLLAQERDWLSLNRVPPAPPRRESTFTENALFYFLWAWSLFVRLFTTKALVFFAADSLLRFRTRWNRNSPSRPHPSLLDGAISANSASSVYGLLCHGVDCNALFAVKLERSDGGRFPSGQNVENVMMSGLSVAIMKGYPGIVRVFLAAGASLTAGFANPVILAVETKQPVLLRALIDARAASEIAAARDWNSGNTALSIAAANGDLECTQILVSCLDRDAVNHLGTGDMTALHRACEAGHVEVVRALLTSRKVNVDIFDREGRTALQSALFSSDCDDSIDIVRALLAAGADPDRDAYRPQSLTIPAPLFVAVAKDHAQCIAALVAAGAKVEAVSNGATPLLMTVGEQSATVGPDSRYRCLDVLLAAGADVAGCRDADGASALHLAVLHDSIRCVAALVAHVDDINALDASGLAPLHLAQSVAAVELLVDAGANLFVLSKRGGAQLAAGMSPFDLALGQRRDPRVIELLRAKMMQAVMTRGQWQEEDDDESWGSY